MPTISEAMSGSPGGQRIWTEPARAPVETLAAELDAAGDNVPAETLLFTVAALLEEMLADPADVVVPSPAVLF